MRDEDRIRLKHMIEACEAVVHFVAGRTREDLDRDRMLFFAVLRAVEIIGEAASKISEGTRMVHVTASELFLPEKLIGMKPNSISRV